MKIHLGDCRESMRRMIAEGVRVQMCVTSPPYWGLRDYGHAGQLGLEPTPQEYVANMVAVFRLVRELLADDGVLFLNLGDSYFGGGRGGGSEGSKQRTNVGALIKAPKWSSVNEPAPHAVPCGTSGKAPSQSVPSVTGRTDTVSSGSAYLHLTTNTLKPKDLMGMPWRVAFALQADGWYLRQDIIWSKPNPMPESVTDRCTKSHEYLFLLSKRERYYYDAAAIKEAAAYPDDKRRPLGSKGAWQMDEREQGENGGGKAYDHNTETRNKRSVWTVATQPYSEAHFATFPPALIEPCILAGSRPGDVVLDPFFGSGTTGEVCERLGRRWIGCELSPEYGKLAAKRTAQQGMTFAQEIAP